MKIIGVVIALLIFGICSFLILEKNREPKEILVDEPKTEEITPTKTAIIGTNMVTIKTAKGNIVLELYSDQAPKTVQNFLNKINSKFYDNLTFHRVEDWVIQGGDPLGTGTGGGKMPTELNDLPFATGSLGVARQQDISVSNDSQFFIVTQDANWLDKQYTNFGKVIEGMDVVSGIQVGDKILSIVLNETP
jgi:cyclophilin family peptidyl-prolyl cis-trans isomerase